MVFLLIIIPLFTSCYFPASLTCQGLSTGFLPFCLPVPGAMYTHGPVLAAAGGQGAPLPRLHKEVHGCAGQEESQPGILHAAGPSTVARARGLCWSHFTVKTSVKRGVDIPFSVFSLNRLISGTWNMPVENHHFGGHQECFLLIRETLVSRKKAWFMVINASRQLSESEPVLFLC